MRNAIAIVILIIVTAGLSAADDSCIAAYNATAVKQFLHDLQEAVAGNNRTRIAEMIEFPITIQVAGKRKILHTRSDFLESYDVAFDRKVRGFIAKQRFSDLFCNWKGIMIGRGEIWINAAGSRSKLEIIAINNNPPWSP